MNPWIVALIVVAEVAERRSLVRDTDRGLLVRVRRGVYVDAGVWRQADAEARHVLRLRAFALVADRPPVFSHWSAAVLHGLPLIGNRTTRIHTVVPDAGARGDAEVQGHVFPLHGEEVVELDGLLVTSIPRTVVDVAGAGTIEDGVVIADAALAAGVPREMLLQAVDLAGPRRAHRRIETVVDFADPGGRSPAESSSRWTMHLIGVEVPVLQYAVFDRRGHVGDADFFFPEARAAGEVDGLKKYLDPRFAPQGAGRKVYDEKIREDRLRAQVPRLARWGWAEARSPRLLAPVLAAAGVLGRRRAFVV